MPSSLVATMKLFKFWLFLIFVIGLPNGGTMDVVLSGETEELDMVLIPSGEFLMGTIWAIVGLILGQQMYSFKHW